MTNEELKKKIIEILEETEYEWTEEKNGYILQIFYDKLADALIAAGLTFGNKHRVLVENAPIPTDYIGNECFLIPNTPPTIKQLYGDEEVEQIVKERDEYKHRAEVAERALENACVVILSSRNGDQPRRLRAYYKAYLEAAEKELAEEREDD